MQKIKVGIIGGSGYVAGELLRCLQFHPKVHIDFVFSHSHAGKTINSIHNDLLAFDNITFTSTPSKDAEVIFLCLGHGNSRSFLEKYSFDKSTCFIDLSNDFRLKNQSTWKTRNFTYGLVDFQKETIRKAQSIANPGCFATGIQLALLPLAKAQMLNQDIHIHAVTGSTGAGKGLTETSHFSWRMANVSIYKPFVHQHLDEIRETLISLQPDLKSKINFIPMRGNFTRGIFTTVYTSCAESEEQLREKYKNFYESMPFTHVTDTAIDLKQVVNTNQCLIHVQKINGNALITCAIDNLIKGAVGQAIQNMNLMCGLDETEGLFFKPNYF